MQGSYSVISPQSPYHAVVELFTADCNLRCVYCPIHTDKTGLPDYPRQRMAPEVIEHTRQLFAIDRPEFINLCGNGETTIMEGWTRICEAFLPFGNVGIISNLAKILSRDEASLIARLGSIATSIDTADAELLKEIRKPVQLRNIVFNLSLVQSAALALGHPPPAMSVNCTVTTRTYQDLVQLVALSSALRVGAIALSDVFETPTSVAHGVRSLTNLNPSEVAQAATVIRQARATAAKSRITMTMNPRLETLLGFNAAAHKDTAIRPMPTVLCLQPWSGFWVNADGRISYCCRHMGTTDEDIRAFRSVREILNHVNALRLREALLSGPCPTRCHSCELGLPAEPKTLRRAIRDRKWSQRIRCSQFGRIVRHVPFVHPLWNAFKRTLSA